MTTGGPPQLLYIAAMSRSGSTLLDLLLDQHPDVASLGELHVLPHDAQKSFGSLPCGCGEPVDVCAVWSTVIDEVHPNRAVPPRLHHFRETHQWGPTIRWKELLDRLSKRSNSSDARRYLRNTEDITRSASAALAAVTGVQPAVVVDASKDPYRLHWLVTPPESTVRVIHLTRDPRAVINSLSRDEEGAQRLWIAARRTAAWIIENALMADSLRGLGPHRHLRVRYEDLATDPNAVLASIHEWLGLHEAPALSDVQTSDSHALAGNPMRRADMAEIKLDERWRSELPRIAQRCIRTATRPLEKRLGGIYV